jgi:PIN domain nuclease of toxin-antitoxin system
MNTLYVVDTHVLIWYFIGSKRLHVKEIHDRIITATARFYRVGVLTKGKVINESGALEP